MQGVPAELIAASLEAQKHCTHALILTHLNLAPQRDPPVQSFEALNQRAVAVVVDPVQSVKGKVVIDAFRLISPQTMMLGQEPRQTTSNLGHLHKPSIQVRQAGRQGWHQLPRLAAAGGLEILWVCSYYNSTTVDLVAPALCNVLVCHCPCLKQIWQMQAHKFLLAGPCLTS